VPRLSILEDRTLPSTFTVTNTQDMGLGSLRQAVLDANGHAGPDAIRFADDVQGTITLSSELSITDDLRILGPGADELTVSGGDTTRVFNIAQGVNVEIDDLTIAHGRATQGGGILNAGTLSLSRDVLTGNTAQGTPNGGNAYGGALYNAGGSVTIDLSAITDNQAVGGDGGDSGPVVLGGFIFVGFGYGGGILNDGGALTISHSTFLNNLAQGGSGGFGTLFPAEFGSGWGGAIASANLFEASGPSVDISDSVLNDNQAIGGSNITATTNISGLSDGGAIQLFAGTTTIRRSTFSGNVSSGGHDNVNAPTQGAGGAITAGGSSSLTILSSTLAYNRAFGGQNNAASSVGGGGALLFADQSSQPRTLTIRDSWFHHNRAVGGTTRTTGGQGEGGALDVLFCPQMQISKSTFTDNQALGGAGAAGAQGGNGVGAAMGIGRSNLPVTGSTFASNRAQGGDGGNGAGGAGGGGGVGSGGAIALAVNSAGDFTTTVSGSFFGDNQAVGGAGGAGAAGFAGGNGGATRGGAITVSDGNFLTLSDSVVFSNVAIGGAGGQGGTLANGGAGGDARGGGVAFRGGSGTVTNVIFLLNEAQGGHGGSGGLGGNGGNGGNGTGGGIAAFTLGGPNPTVTLSDSLFVLNAARGGAGGNGGAGGVGGNGGNGQGGGLWAGSSTTATIQQSAFILNEANGGAAGVGGSAGQGKGGGLYIDPASTVCLDAFTVAHLLTNHASTSDPDVFGFFISCP
jgi:hypothetical protein